MLTMPSDSWSRMWASMRPWQSMTITWPSAVPNSTCRGQSRADESEPGCGPRTCVRFHCITMRWRPNSSSEFNQLAASLLGLWNSGMHIRDVLQERKIQALCHRKMSRWQAFVLANVLYYDHIQQYKQNKGQGHRYGQGHTHHGRCMHVISSDISLIASHDCSHKVWCHYWKLAVITMIVTTTIATNNNMTLFCHDFLAQLFQS